MPRSSAKTSKPAISVQKLNVTLSGTTILRDASFEVPEGSITAIIGENGSGKTTLVRALLGLTPSTGTIRFFGTTLDRVRLQVGYVPQRFEFDRDFPITIGEFLNLARRADTPREHILHTLREVGLTSAVMRKRLGDLSGGQLQRVLIAQAILNNPRILVLDEPATGIDVTGEATIMHVLEHLRAEHHTTIVMISHDLHLIEETVDHAVLVQHGIKAAGKPRDVLRAYAAHA